MQKRGWLQAAYNFMKGITQQDYDNCAKLENLTGLSWEIGKRNYGLAYKTSPMTKKKAICLADAINSQVFRLPIPRKYKSHLDLAEDIGFYDSASEGILDIDVEFPVRHDTPKTFRIVMTKKDFESDKARVARSFDPEAFKRHTAHMLQKIDQKDAKQDSETPKLSSLAL